MGNRAHIQYRSRTAIKAQALANFVAEFTMGGVEEEELTAWMVWTNGFSNQRVGGAGVLLRTPERDIVKCAVYLQFSTTNNEAEYKAVLSGIDLAKAVGATLAIMHCNSQVVVGHINSNYEAKGEQMKKYLSMILREENERADRLAKAASVDYMNTTNKVLSFMQYAPAIDKLEVQVIPTGTDWTTPIISYLKDGTLPEDHNASRRLKLKFLIVGIDYFTKWVEVKPLATIIERNVRNFDWKSIIYRFGIPRFFVFDNGKQFDNDAFRDFCRQLGVKNHYFSRAHPKSTAYRTTAATPIGETPFHLAYGHEAIIPAEIGLTSYRISHHNGVRNEEGLRLQLNLLEEVRATSEQRMARYQDLMAKHYNTNF
ncbi:uncharacterized protein LOC142625003 [Castanea sativa]|uniref:uncharacterized protein LOC142625003 n=1 Tax=Castanea sativa TaxID=21020 RepID=UPI003F64A655